MVTYGDLFTFVIMLCAVITLVVSLMIPLVLQDGLQVLQRHYHI